MRLPVIHKVVTVVDNYTVAEAFDWMCQNKANGVAVVNYKGNLVGNLSASDFEGVTMETLPALTQSMVAEVISKQVS